MKQLPVDLDELITAMQAHFDEATHYLDTETGKLELIDETLVRELEDETEGEEDDLGSPDWEKELLPIARAIAAGDKRYVRLPEPDPHEDYRLMSRFAAGVQDPHARQRLEDALDGRGAFRRFRRVLGDHPELRDQWHAAHDAATREQALEWLAELGIEANLTTTV
jgi:hypothetical protein